MQSEEHKILIKKKSIFNKRANSLIKDIISLKRGINGKGDGKNNIPASSIKEPLPEELNKIISQLNSNFSTTLQLCSDIIDNQNNLNTSNKENNLEEFRKPATNITKIDSAKRNVRSSDPEQETIRQLKIDFSNNASNLISLLIVLKKGINGVGDSNYNIPSFSIKEKIPSQINSLISELSSSYQNIMSECNNIILKQKQYSVNRQKSKSEINPMDKTASNWFTRNWARLSQYPVFRNNPSYRSRMGILFSAAETVKNLVQIESQLLSGKTSELDTVVNQFNTSVNSFLTITFTELKQLNAIHTMKTPDGLDVIMNSFEYDLESELKDLNIDDNTAKSIINSFNSLKNESEKLNQENSDQINSFIEKYNKFISLLKLKLNIDKDLSSLREILLYAKENKNPVNIKEANKLLNFVNRKLLDFSDDSFDRIKLFLAKNIESTINSLDELQDLMENDNWDSSNTKKILLNILEKINVLADSFSSIIDVYDNKVRSDISFYKKDKDKFVGLQPISSTTRASLKRTKNNINSFFQNIGGKSEQNKNK
jgi:hypothetical protein